MAEEINFIRPQEVYDRNTGESKVRYRSYDGNDRFIPVVNGEKGVPKTMVEVTHAELKAMRDAGKLTAGALYRITDYNCTTTQANTQSAGHQFDIVLLALSENKLAEEGWAMMNDNIYDVTFSDGVTKKCWIYRDDYIFYTQNIVDCESLLGYEGFSNDEITINEEQKTAVSGAIGTVDLDTPNLTYNYFQNSNLSAWKVWYCLDNDKSRFAWADEENGKGVIYRLIDEFNNDIKYDFKNIQFKRKITNGQYDATNGTETWCYTLNIWYDGMCQDASIVGNTLPNDEGFVNGVYDNKFGYATAYDVYIEGVNTFAFALGNNVVLSTFEGVYYGFYSNTIGNSFNSNTVGNGFSSNTIGNHFGGNIIGNDFTSNTIGNAFTINTIESVFTANVIENYFGGNTIRGNFEANMIGNRFSNKTISNDTYYKNYGNNGVELATKS